VGGRSGSPRTLSRTPIPLATLLSVQGEPAQIRLRTAAAMAYVGPPYPIDKIWRVNQPGVAAMEIGLERTGVYLKLSGADGFAGHQAPGRRRDVPIPDRGWRDAWYRG
jgi:hypothetical protein